MHHSTHNPDDDVDALGLSIDPLIKEKVVELVHMGLVGVNFQRELSKAVVSIATELGIEIDSVDTRFYPTEQTLRNVRRNALDAGRLSTIDQEACRLLVEKLSIENPHNHYVFRPFKKDESKIMVFMQTQEQQRLLLRYHHAVYCY
jgi:hypothetical protein